jgi:sucrose-phosphate synthase
LAARSRGVFVNPAFTEPFGLTLLEAAASGLPVVATNDGGPREIVARCRNGVLVDPLAPEAMGRTILEAIRARRLWGARSRAGVAGVHQGYSWDAHARRYVRALERIREQGRHTPAVLRGSRLPHIDRLLVSDLDHTLTGDDGALESLARRLREGGDRVGFGIATGRPLEEAIEVLDELPLPQPDVLITDCGAELHYSRPPDRRLTRDRSWRDHIAHRWEPTRVRGALAELDGVEPRDGGREEASPLRLRYLRKDSAPSESGIRRHLRRAGLKATVILDRETELDVLPVRASPGLAVRFFCFKWKLNPDRLLVAGDSGNDRDMLSGDAMGVVVGNRSPELVALRGQPRVYFAEGSHARGILEAMDRLDFTGEFTTTTEEELA